MRIGLHHLALSVFMGLAMLLCACPARAQDSSGSQGQGGFSISGGAGPAGINGAAGTSPRLVFSDIGLGRATGQQYRFSYPYRLPGLEIRLTGDQLVCKFTGQATYSGEPWTSFDDFVSGHSYYYGFVQGDRVQSSLDIKIRAAAADLALTVARLPGLGEIQVGPRFQWFGYNDEYVVQNQGNTQFLPGSFTQPRTYAKSRNYSCYGGGLVGVVNLDGLFSSSTANVRPRVRIAGAMVKGDVAQASTFEIMCELFLSLPSPRTGSASSIPIPGVLIEAGYMRISFEETRYAPTFPGTGEPAPGYPGPTGNGSADYRLTLPVIRGTISF